MSEECGSAGQPKGLLEELEELMATLNADLSALTDLHGGEQGCAEEAGLA
ncbi:hypothetical protein AB0L59_12605 [Streptomyces sp. NPDC052109]